MKTVIAFPRVKKAEDEPAVSVVYPSGEISLKAVAVKDVPSGVPYLYIDAEAVPLDAVERAQWVLDFSQPHGFGGAV